MANSCSCSSVDGTSCRIGWFVRHLTVFSCVRDTHFQAQRTIYSRPVLCWSPLLGSVGRPLNKEQDSHDAHHGTEARRKVVTDNRTVDKVQGQLEHLALIGVQHGTRGARV